MKIIPLPLETQVRCGFSHKVAVGYADLSAAAVTKTLTIFPDGSAQLPACFTVLRTGYILRTPFVGALVTALTLDIGDGDSASRYLGAASTDLVAAIGTNTKEAVVSTTAFSLGADIVGASHATIKALFTATGANTSVLTAGLVDIYLLLSDLARLKAVNEPGTT